MYGLALPQIFQDAEHPVTTPMSAFWVYTILVPRAGVFKLLSNGRAISEAFDKA